LLVALAKLLGLFGQRPPQTLILATQALDFTLQSVLIWPRSSGWGRQGF